MKKVDILHNFSIKKESQMGLKKHDIESIIHFLSELSLWICAFTIHVLTDFGVVKVIWFFSVGCFFLLFIYFYVVM